MIVLDVDTSLIVDELGNIEQLLQAVSDKLDGLDYLLGVADVCLLVFIGSAAAIVVVLIFYNLIMKCISKF